MNMKKLLCLIGLCSLLSSCITDVKLDDVDTDISLNPALALPIGNVHAHIVDLLSFVDSTYLKEDTSNGMFVYYKQDNQSMNFKVDEFSNGETLNETLTLRTISELSEVFDLLDQIGLKKAPLPQGNYAFQKKTLYHFGFNEYIEGEKDVHIDSAIIQHAEIYFDVWVEGIELTEGTYLELDFHFPGLLEDEYANKFENIKINKSNFEYKNTMEHFMAHFDSINTTNAVDLIVDFRIISDGNSEIHTNAKINFKTDIKFMNFKEIYGHVWQKDKYKNEAVTFNMPTNLFESDILKNNKILFSNPQLNITLKSNIGVPMLLQIENFHYTKNGEEHVINTANTCNFPINTPSNVGENYTTYFEFNKENSPIAKILSEFPEKIKLDWAVYANDSIREHVHYFINPIIADMDFEVTIPIQFDPTTHITHKDTIAANLENLLSSITDIVNIDTLSIYLDIASSIPATAEAKLSYYDENFNLLYDSKVFEIEAGVLDGDGRVINPTIQNKVIGFNSNLAKEIITTKNIIFEIGLKTKDDNSKLYIQTTDKIDINLSAYAKANINITTNIEK